MFRKIASFFASAILLAGFTGCSLTERDIIEKEYTLEVPPKMVFLGDSIAAGYGLEGYTADDNYNCESYSNILKEKYTAELSEICPADMYNFAVSGATSDDLLDLLDTGTLDSALAEADAVVISIGGNDMLHVLFGLLADLGMTAENPTIDLENVNIFSALAQLIDLEDDIDTALDGFERNIKKVSSEINERTSGKVYFQTLYNPFENFDLQMLADLSEDKIGRYNEIVRNNAGDYTVIEVAEPFSGKSEELTRISKLDIHPNEKGHKLIAEIVDSSFRADGFTCIVQEYSEPHLTTLAIVLILIGVIAIIAVLLVIPKLFKKHDSTEKKESGK